MCNVLILLPIKYKIKMVRGKEVRNFGRNPRVFSRKHEGIMEIKVQ